MRFSWDPRKAASNHRKHRVTFEEAATVFVDPLAIVSDETEQPGRSLIIGESFRQRVLLTVFAEREGNEIRITSARRATSHERRRYQDG